MLATIVIKLVVVLISLAAGAIIMAWIMEDPYTRYLSQQEVDEILAGEKEALPMGQK